MSLTNRRDMMREFLERVEPLNRIKLNALNRSIPKYTLYPDGRFVVVHPAWIQAILDRCDAEIAQIANTFKEDASPDNGSAIKMT